MKGARTSRSGVGSNVKWPSSSSASGGSSTSTAPAFSKVALATAVASRASSSDCFRTATGPFPLAGAARKVTSTAVRAREKFPTRTITEA